MPNFPTDSRSGKWLMVLLIALLLMLCLATLTSLYLQLSGRQGMVEEASRPQHAEIPAPEFVNVGPMTVNLQSDSYGSRLLYIGLALRIGHDRTRQIIETHRPEVHSRLLVLLSSQKAESLTAPGGKEQLSRDIIQSLSEPLDADLPPLTVHNVLFTDFIVQ